MKTYGSEPGAPSSVRVGISELVVSDEDETLTSYGLGSCLAIALYDVDAGIGGLAHAMLPSGDEAENGDAKPGKYADTAIRALLRRMVENGANYTSVEAKIAGGSEMIDFNSKTNETVGDRNVAAAKAELERLGVPVVAQDTGGTHGRTVEFTTGTGVLTVRTADREHGVKRL